MDDNIQKDQVKKYLTRVPEETIKMRKRQLSKNSCLRISQNWGKTKLLNLKDCCCCCCQGASVVSDSARPRRRQPTRLPSPWDSPGKNTGVGCYYLLQCMKVKSESEVAQSCPTLRDPMDCSLPGSSVHRFSRQEYWSGVPLPSPLKDCCCCCC